MGRELYCGIDAGAAATKVVLVGPDRAIAGFGVRRTGVDFTQAARSGLDEALAGAGGAAEADVRRIVATGYGRSSVDATADRKTEIACHARAAYFHCPRRIIVVDIGGQDSKVIRVDAGGMRTAFLMNRKCAAGTGAFLEEIALHLGVPIEEMNALAERSREPLTLGSFCTVFTKTEILTLARQGRKIEDIVRAVYDSVAKRVVEMDPLDGEVVMTGGVVAYHGVVARLLEERIGRAVTIPPRPQLAGAFGAALFALEGA